jgi:hypothetical protein
MYNSVLQLILISSWYCITINFADLSVCSSCPLQLVSNRGSLEGCISGYIPRWKGMRTHTVCYRKYTISCQGDWKKRRRNESDVSAYSHRWTYESSKLTRELSPIIAFYIALMITPSNTVAAILFVIMAVLTPLDWLLSGLIENV